MPKKLDLTKLNQTVCNGSLYDSLGLSASDYTDDEKKFIVGAVGQRLRRHGMPFLI